MPLQRDPAAVEAEVATARDDRRSLMPNTIGVLTKISAYSIFCSMASILFRILNNGNKKKRNERPFHRARFSTIPIKSRFTCVNRKVAAWSVAFFLEHLGTREQLTIVVPSPDSPVITGTDKHTLFGRPDGVVDHGFVSLEFLQNVSRLLIPDVDKTILRPSHKQGIVSESRSDKVFGSVLMTFEFPERARLLSSIVGSVSQ